MATEEPQYQVLAQDARFEVRQYAPYIVAETLVEGDMDAASSKGFRAIADYIFGNNRVEQTNAPTKIAMTAPVAMEPVPPASTKIAMTAPVVMQSDSAVVAPDATQRWRVHFVMPRAYTLETLPRPNNSAVQLRAVASKQVAVVRYSGINSEERVQEETRALTRWIEARNLMPASKAQLARYNPPWTLPMWRRNEIHIDITPVAPG